MLPSHAGQQRAVWNSREDWIIVENTHEPIISKELFSQAQAVIQGRTRFIKKQGEPHIFTGLFFCDECGRRMVYHARNKYSDYYSCGRYREKGMAGCSSHHIAFDNIYKVVLQDIRKNVLLMQSDEAEAIKGIVRAKRGNGEHKLTQTKKALAKAQKRLSELNAKIKKVYEDNVSGKLPDNLFSMFLQDYEGECLALKNTVKTLEIELRALEANRTNEVQFIELLKKYAGIENLHRHILTELIEKITVSEDRDQAGKRDRRQTIAIHYRFVGVL